MFYSRCNLYNDHAVLYFSNRFTPDENVDEVVKTLVFDVLKSLNEQKLIKQMTRLFCAAEKNGVTANEQATKWLKSSTVNSRLACARMIKYISIKDGLCRGTLNITLEKGLQRVNDKNTIKCGYDEDYEDDGIPF
ncbi:hypothetical protein [Acidithiobacillus thiooxidans]|uniref:hypothetical protein n=1 Tax=Acidithiobacillus thiooxidans TaxID=930 RepID=UPI001C076E1F|nr:hypothetical protein [Acidithiobacillus thiooxidans]MBU2843544.1 hypothetical protein [Acidithiobacillus thiooxidans]